MINLWWDAEERERPLSGVVKGAGRTVGLFDTGPTSRTCKHCNYWDRLELILNRTAKIYNYKTGQLEPRLQL